MAELIAIIILLSSIIGMGVIIFRKIPVLVELPEISPQEKRGEALHFFQKGMERIKGISPFKSFSYEIFLQKILSKIRILNLKSENKIANWLQRLREKSQKKKLDDNYWEEIKKSTKKK